MKRTDADQHLAFTFQNEGPGTDGTLIDDTFMNAVQEEISNAIESSEVLNPADDRQLQAYLRRLAFNPLFGAGTAASWNLANGTPFGTQAQGGFVEQINGGQAVLNGKLVELSDARLSWWLGSNRFYTFTANRDTYISFHEDGGACPSQPLNITEEANGAPEPTPAPGFVNVIRVVTDGSGVTASTNILPNDEPIITTDPRFTGTPRLSGGLEVHGSGGPLAAQAMNTDIGSTFGVFDGDMVRGPWVVHAQTLSTSAVNVATGYTLPDDAFVTVEYSVLSYRNDDATKSHRLKGEKTFRRSGGGAPVLENVHTDEVLTETAAAIPADVATITVSGNNLVFQFDAGENGLYNHKITLTVSEASHGV